jgi:hypothetical protein
MMGTVFGEGMMVRFAALIIGVLAAGSAPTQNMNPEAARRFVTGKLFAFRCVDGSGGSDAFTVSHKQTATGRSGLVPFGK